MEQPKPSEEEARHEEIARKYERLSMYDAFDRFVDMALEGEITLKEAINAFEEEYSDTLGAT